jgi:predicted MFS family arabinose efflux permease
MTSAANSRTALKGRWALPFLGIACAVGVGSIYYNQPLLMVMGQSFSAAARAMGFVAVATQVGYAAGILFFVPLGDIAERRSLMMRMYGAVSLGLLAAAFAQNLTWMILASVFIGLMASVTHVALPMAPDLVPRDRRGQAIGTVMTGLLLGILLARSFAGWVARFSNFKGALSIVSGWRAVFLVAAVMNAVFIPIIARAMPRMLPQQSLTYGQALHSLWGLFRDKPLLREAGVIGALTFACFSCFWTTIAFVLHAHYGMGPGIAGTFGVVGAAGAFIAPVAGKLADRKGPRYVVGAAGAVVMASYLWLWFSESLKVSVPMHMAGLVVGVIALDVGAQMMQVANQTRIFGLGAEARNRLNTVYMTMYFVGGALGSALASVAWSRWQWDGVCALAIGLIALAGLRHATGYSRNHKEIIVPVPRSEQEPA